MVTIFALYGCVVFVTIENMLIQYRYSRSAMAAVIKHLFDIAFLSLRQISLHFLIDSGLYTRVIYPFLVFFFYGKKLPYVVTRDVCPSVRGNIFGTRLHYN